MAWIKLIGIVVVFSIIVYLLYAVLKAFVFSRFKPNKWIVLAVAILVFFIPIILRLTITNSIFSIIQSGIFVILFLWFMDLMGLSARPNNKKQTVVIKPKAKPNRAKNIK